MDDVFRLAWKRYRTWAATARSLKKSDDGWKRAVLTLTIVGTVAGTLGPFVAVTSWSASAAGYSGAAALALATYFGKQLLDAAHQQNWTRARAAAEAFKSETYRYAVQAPPYNAADSRMSRLAARIGELDELTKGRAQVVLSDAEATKNVLTAFLSIDEYVTRRVNEQAEWYRGRAKEHQDAISRGRALALAFGGLAALLSIFSATRTDGTLAAASLGIVTTLGASIGAYFQAGHYEAIALKYRETADALDRKVVEFRAAPSPQSQQQLVVDAETLMQAENAAWLNEVTAKT